MLKILFKFCELYVFDDVGYFLNCWVCVVVIGFYVDVNFMEFV